METKALEKILDKHTEAIEKRLTEQTDELKRHQKMLLEEFDSRLKVVAEIQVNHTKKFEALFEMVAMNTETLEFIKSMLKRKVDMDEYERLEKRVLVLEKKLRLSGV